MNARGRVSRRWVIAAGCAVGLGCAPAATETADRCGEGTAERFGTCVAVVDPSATCGEGTVFVESTSECVPRVACGEGTTLDTATGECRADLACGTGSYRDPASGACLPTARCGTGTVLNPGTGACENAVECGAGTTRNATTGACEALEQCGPGTALNPSSGQCESMLACGTDQVRVGNRCVLPNDVLGLEADIAEPVAENNDPLTGGTPEVLVLEPAGQRTVFTGVIGRPRDDGDGVLVQDRDAWQFQGTARQALHVRVLSNGVPEPAFILEGPGGYRRESTPGAWEAERHIVLARDGTYVLTIVPASFLRTGVPLGGADAGYTASIEVVAFPAASAVTPAAPGQAATARTVIMDELLTGVFRPRQAAGSAAVVLARTLAAGVVPHVMVFGTDERPRQDAVLEVESSTRQRNWLALVAQATDDVVVVVDFVRAPAAGASVSVEFQAAAQTTPVTVTSDFSAVTEPTDVPADSFVVHRMEAAQDVVLLLRSEVMTSSVDWQFLRAGARPRWVLNTASAQYAAGAGTVTMVLRNRSTTSDRNGAYVLADGNLATLVGTLDVGDAPVRTRGAFFRYWANDEEGRWLSLSAARDGLLSVAMTWTEGPPEILLVDSEGITLRGIRDLRDRTVHRVVKAGEDLFVKVSSNGGNTLDWEASVELLPLPPMVDEEPNDSPLTAGVIPQLPARVRGTLQANTFDMFSVSFPSPLAEGQALEVTLDNLTTDAASPSSTTDALRVRVLDDYGQPLATITQGTGITGGNYGANTITVVPGVGMPEEIILQVDDASLSETTDYVLGIRVIDVATEEEPNDALLQASPAGVAPLVAYGWYDAADVDDHWSFTLPSDVPAGDWLHVSVEGLRTDNNSRTVEVRNSANDVVGTVTGTGDRVVRLTDLRAGAYTVRTRTTSTVPPPYRLTVQHGHARETEPNDDGTRPMDLGLLPAAGIILDAATTRAGGITDDDVFTFRLAAPLATDQSIRVLALAQGSSTLVTELFAGPNPSTSALVASDISAFATLYSAALPGAGPFAVRVARAATTDGTTEYRLVVDTGGPAEKEPNDARATATPLPLGRAMLGVSNNADPDAYVVAMPQGLGSGRRLRVVVTNEIDSSTLNAALKDAAFVDLVTPAARRSVTMETAPGAPGIAFYVSVQSTQAASSGTDVYSVFAEVTDAP